MQEIKLSKNITIIQGDCREIGPVACDAVITDPPYGMSLNTDFSGMNGWSYAPVVGDDAPFDPSPWLSVGGSQVFWGAQYFCHRLPEVGGWLVFNKRGEGAPSEMCFGDCELAWCSVGQAVRMYSHMWHGVARWSSEGRLHPTQKPVSLMSWCFDRAKVAPGAIVLDPYMGSGTTGIACIRTGRRFIGIEIDEQHYQTARQRLLNELAQTNLFRQNEAGAQNTSEGRGTACNSASPKAAQISMELEL